MSSRDKFEAKVKIDVSQPILSKLKLSILLR